MTINTISAIECLVEDLKNMIAASTSGLTALFFALIVLMQLVYGIDALG